MRMTWIFPLPSLHQSTHHFSHMLKFSFNFNFFTSIFKLTQACFFSNTATATQMWGANHSPCNFYSYSSSDCYVNRIFQAKQWSIYISLFSPSPLIPWNLLPILLISFLLNPGMFVCFYQSQVTFGLCHDSFLSETLLLWILELTRILVSSSWLTVPLGSCSIVKSWNVPILCLLFLRNLNFLEQF